MPKSLNLCQFIGHCGKKPETKFTQSGVAVSSFSLATNTRYKDKSGEWNERVEWINITCWDRLAEIAEQYLDKGSKIYISGRMETQSWEKDGHKNYKTVIVAHDLIMLDGKQDGGERQERGEPRSESRSDSRSSSRGGGEPEQSQPVITDEDVPFTFSALQTLECPRRWAKPSIA